MGFLLRQSRLLRRKLNKHWILVLWIALCTGVYYLDYIKYKYGPQYYYLRRMLGLGMCVSRGTAAVLNLSCCLLVFPMCRALTVTLTSAFKLILFRNNCGLSNHATPTLPVVLTSQVSQTTKSLHVLIAVTVIIASGAHTCAHISNAFNFSWYYDTQYPVINVFTIRGENPLVFFLATVPGVTGIALLIILAILMMTSTKWARRRNYNAFFYTHYLGLLFFLLLLLHPHCGILKKQQNLHGHVPGCQMIRSSYTQDEGFHEPQQMPYFEATANSSTSDVKQGPYRRQDVDTVNGDSDLNEEEEVEMENGVAYYLRRKTCNEAPVFHSIYSQTWIWISCALLVWIAECSVRWHRHRAKVQIVDVVHHPCNVVQLTLHQSGFSCFPGQYVLIQCPEISRFEWHPFTVTSSPTEYGKYTFTILMRIQGDWSSQVARLLKHFVKSSQHIGSELPTCSFVPKESRLERFEHTYTNYNCQSFPHSQPLLTDTVCPSVARQSSSEKMVHPYMDYNFHLYSCRCNQCICKFTKVNRMLCDSDYHFNYSSTVFKNIYSPELLDKCNLKSLKRSLSHVTKKSLQTESLYTNLSELKRNSNSLPISYIILSSSAESAQENKPINSEPCSCGLICNRLSSTLCEKHHLTKCVHARQKIENHTLSYFPSDASQVHIQCEDEFKHPRKEKEDLVVNMSFSSFSRIKVDGPYSSPNEEMLQYPVIIGTAGGIGITPLAATLSHKICHPKMWPRRIHMVWVVRDARLILVVAPLLSTLLLQCWRANMEDSIDLRLHVTVPTTMENLQDLFGKDYPCLLPRITQGRPHWKHLFREWQSVYSRMKVGVFACGPRKMCGQVKRHSLQALSRGAQFDYHQECFS